MSETTENLDDGVSDETPVVESAAPADDRDDIEELEALTGAALFEYRAIQLKSGRYEYPISKPVKDIDGEELHALRIRKPKPKDLRLLDTVPGEIAGIYAITARCAGIKDSEIDDMEWDDLLPITDWVQSFLPGGAAPTGAAR